jgi:hypothetical protein
MRAQQARHNVARRTIQEVTVDLAQGGLADFHSQTVGTLTKKDLRRIKHPYARLPRTLNVQKLAGKRGYAEGKKAQVSTRGRVSDLPINKQTGKLKRSIKLRRKQAGGAIVYHLYATAPYAKFVLNPEGTKYMRPRGLLGPKGLLRKRHKARHAGIVKALQQAHKSI